jgi:hypothetical protein
VCVVVPTPAPSLPLALVFHVVPSTWSLPRGPFHVVPLVRVRVQHIVSGAGGD